MNLNLFKSWSCELAYFLGWLITDGCVEMPPINTRYLISWELKDEEPLLIFKTIFQSEKKIEITKNGKYKRLRLCGKEIVEKVISYGIMPRKTFITRLPKIPYEFMSHFMRGVLEGDGTITIRSGGYFNRSDYKRLTVDIASGNEQFPIDIISYLGYGKFLPNYGKIGHQSCRASFDCSNAVKFLNWTYQNSDGLRLTRKWNTWQSFLECGQTYK